MLEALKVRLRGLTSELGQSPLSGCLTVHVRSWSLKQSSSWVVLERRG
jgi:hypothetical protein